VKRDDGPRKASPTEMRRVMDNWRRYGLDPRGATKLGELNMAGEITDSEFAAGCVYAEIVGAMDVIKGCQPRHTVSPSFEGGKKSAPTLDMEALERMDPEVAAKVRAAYERRVRKIKERWAKIEARLPAPAHRDLDTPSGSIDVMGGSGSLIVQQILETACCNDGIIHSAYLPVLKNTLAMLARDVFKFSGATTVKAKDRAKPKLADARMIAEGAVGAVADWFRRRDASITVFRIAPAHSWQARKIAVYGTNGHGRVIEREIRVPRGALMASEIDAELHAAALARGWTEATTEEATATAEQIAAGIDKLRSQQETA
jgi:hypothetical protein